MLKRFFFNFIYNPVYDFTTARISYYSRLHQVCISKLEFRDNDTVLCVGIGTGNEIIPILQRNSNVNITGVDTSDTALYKAYKKALARGKELKLLKMDAHRLDFDDDTFDKVVCIHLMCFLDDDREASAEILRVLKSGGQFVITYPSGDVGFKMVGEIKRSVCHNFRSLRFKEAIKETLAAIGATIFYTPVTFPRMPVSLLRKPGQGFHSRESLNKRFATLKLRKYQIETDSVYQDFIVYGKK